MRHERATGKGHNSRLKWTKKVKKETKKQNRNEDRRKV